MKNTATYYFIAQAALHALLGWALVHLNGMMLRTYAEHFDGRALPAATTLALSFYWWPHLIALLAAIGAVVAVLVVDRFRILQHVAFGMQLASSFLMLICAVGYAVPFVSIVSVMSE